MAESLHLLLRNPASPAHPPGIRSRPAPAVAHGLRRSREPLRRLKFPSLENVHGNHSRPGHPPVLSKRNGSDPNSAGDAVQRWIHKSSRPAWRRGNSPADEEGVRPDQEIEYSRKSDAASISQFPLRGTKARPNSLFLEEIAAGPEASPRLPPLVREDHRLERVLQSVPTPSVPASMPNQSESGRSSKKETASRVN